MPYILLFAPIAVLAFVLIPLVPQGRNYNMLFLVAPAFLALVILCMLGVTKGEAKQAKVTH